MVPILHHLHVGVLRCLYPTKLKLTTLLLCQDGIVLPIFHDIRCYEITSKEWTIPESHTIWPNLRAHFPRIAGTIYLCSWVGRFEVWESSISFILLSEPGGGNSHVPRNGLLHWSNWADWHERRLAQAFGGSNGGRVRHKRHLCLGFGIVLKLIISSGASHIGRL